MKIKETKNLNLNNIEYGNFYYTVINGDIVRVRIENIYEIMQYRTHVRLYQNGEPTDETFNLGVEHLFKSIQDAKYFIEADEAMNRALRSSDNFELSAQEIREDEQLERHLNTTAGLDHLNYEN